MHKKSVCGQISHPWREKEATTEPRWAYFQDICQANVEPMGEKTQMSI